MPADRRSKPALLLLGRPGCHLCEEFEAELLAQIVGGRGWELQHADVDSRPDWRERFGRRIPVLLDGAGNLICETHLDAAAVAKLLAGGA